MERFLLRGYFLLVLALIIACESNQLNSQLVIWYENGSSKITHTDFEVYLDGQLLLKKDTLTYTGIADLWYTYERHLRDGFYWIHLQ